MGKTQHVAKGDRAAACERGRVRDAQEPEPSGCRLLESGLRSKDSRAVRRGAIGKVPERATRWWPTLPHVSFLGGWTGAIPPGYPAPGPIDPNPFFRVSRARGRCCPSSASTDSYPPHTLLSLPGVSPSANPRQPRPHAEVIPHHRQERHDEPAAEHLVAVCEVAVLLAVQDASQQVDVAEHSLVALLLVSEDVQHHALVGVPVEGDEGTEEQRLDWGPGSLGCRH